MVIIMVMFMAMLAAATASAGLLIPVLAFRTAARLAGLAVGGTRALFRGTRMPGGSGRGLGRVLG